MATTNTVTGAVYYYDANGISVPNNFYGITQAAAASLIAAAFVSGVVYRIELRGF